MTRETNAPPLPAKLWLVRHGQSAGNVARDKAREAKAERIDIRHRDMDVPLSELGREQAAALGDWFAAQPAGDRPNLVLASPYLRARDTAQIVADRAGLSLGDGGFRLDERLREREFGVLDRLTNAGIRSQYPEQAAMRSSLGKFYYRPPGGESWCDVILRLRSIMNSLSVRHAGERVLIAAHQVVVLCLRYILEEMTEGEILAIDRAAEVPNASVTEYALDPSGRRLDLVRYNFTAPMERAGAAITAEPSRERRQA